MRVSRRLKTTRQLPSTVVQQELYGRRIGEWGLSLTADVSYCGLCLFKLNVLVCSFRFHILIFRFQFLIFV